MARRNIRVLGVAGQLISGANSNQFEKATTHIMRQLISSVDSSSYIETKENRIKMVHYHYRYETA